MTSAPLDRTPAWMLASAAMLSAQLGAAISVGLFDEIGVAGTAWLRITLGAIGFVLIARPRYWRWTWRELRAPVLLGVVSAVMTLSFLAAIDLLPLGTVVAIGFLGPLTVAALHSRTCRALAWPTLALVGVVLLTEPWQGTPSLLGIAYAALAGVCWGLYIVVTQHVGDRFAGVDGLAISLPVAAVVTASTRRMRRVKMELRIFSACSFVLFAMRATPMVKRPKSAAMVKSPANSYTAVYWPYPALPR